MIHTQIGFHMNAVYSNINKAIDIGALEGAKKEAEEFQKDARANLTQSIKGKSTGNLAKAIGVKNAGIMMPGLVRYDVVVDTSKAPYAWWIESGALAPVGVPYSNKGKQDFSKSTFKGYKYLEKTLEQHKENGKPTEIVGKEVFKKLLTLI